VYPEGERSDDRGAVLVVQRHAATIGAARTVNQVTQIHESLDPVVTDRRSEPATVDALILRHAPINQRHPHQHQATLTRTPQIQASGKHGRASACVRVAEGKIDFPQMPRCAPAYVKARVHRPQE
jgi:hypothetical protein